MCVRKCVCAYVRVCVLGREKNTNGDETDTFPDGSANITLPDGTHTRTHANVLHLMTRRSKVLGLTLEEPMTCRCVKTILRRLKSI